MGALFGACAVILGAFGAHALHGRIDDAALQIWRTGVDYQMWHAIGLLAVAVHTSESNRARKFVAVAWTFGIVLFSGSLYALALGASHWIGAVTPFGGLALISGWLALALDLWRSRPS